MKIIAEIENTLAGNVVVTKDEKEHYHVGILNENDDFEVKHPDLRNTESVINALAFYFQAEANARNKLLKK